MNLFWREATDALDRSGWGLVRDGGMTDAASVAALARFDGSCRTEGRLRRPDLDVS